MFVGYFDYGFLFLQHRIDMGIINTLRPSLNMSKIEVYMRRFPLPSRSDIKGGNTES